jgi:hypothetical protein
MSIHRKFLSSTNYYDDDNIRKACVEFIEENKLKNELKETDDDSILKTVLDFIKEELEVLSKLKEIDEYARIEGTLLKIKGKIITNCKYALSAEIAAKLIEIHTFINKNYMDIIYASYNEFDTEYIDKSLKLTKLKLKELNGFRKLKYNLTKTKEEDLDRRMCEYHSKIRGKIDELIKLYGKDKIAVVNSKYNILSKDYFR